LGTTQPGARTSSPNPPGERHGALNPEDGSAPAATLEGSDSVAIEERSGALSERPRRGRISVRTFESFNDRDFRWFFLSMCGHFTAVNTQMFVRGFLVFQLTGSHAALGFVQLAGALPQLVFSAVGGVLADMIPQKKWIVQVGQLVNAVNAAWIAFFLFIDALTVEHLVIAAMIQGLVNSLMMPARQAMTPEVVGESRLMNALALNTAGMNFARLMMPGLAGYMIALVGTGEGTSGAEWVYALMTAVYLWAVLSLFMVPDFHGRRERERTLRTALRDVTEGFRYIKNTPAVRAVLIVNLLIVVTSLPYFFLLPGFVDEVLHGGSSTLGALMSLQGAGSLAGSLMIASLPPRRRGRLLLASGMVMSFVLIAFFWTTWLWVSGGLLAVIGVAHATRMTLSNVLVQTYTEPDYRGRVMSIYMMEFSIVMLGVFVVGLAADRFGVQQALTGSSIALLALMVYSWVFIPTFRELE